MGDYDEDARFVKRLQSTVEVHKRRGTIVYYILIALTVVMVLYAIADALVWPLPDTIKSLHSYLWWICIFFILFIVHGYLRMKREHFLKKLIPFADQVFQCPHCETEISILRDWICGWCGERWSGENSWLKGGKFIFDPCDVSSCKEIPNAVRCPECGNDIVVRSKSYEQERAKGRRTTAGVARVIVSQNGQRSAIDELGDEWR